VHVAPAGAHAEPPSGAAIAHVFVVVLQTFEQHSAAVAAVQF
jgi:hypothetical protein